MKAATFSAVPLTPSSTSLPVTTVSLGAVALATLSMTTACRIARFFTIRWTLSVAVVTHGAVSTGSADARGSDEGAHAAVGDSAKSSRSARATRFLKLASVSPSPGGPATSYSDAMNGEPRYSGGARRRGSGVLNVSSPTTGVAASTGSVRCAATLARRSISSRTRVGVSDCVRVGC